MSRLEINPCDRLKLDADWVYEARLDGELMFLFGGIDQSLILRSALIWLIPEPGFSAARVRPFLPLWRKFISERGLILALIRPKETRAVRFAKFFGLNYIQRHDEEFDLYGISNSTDSGECGDEPSWRDAGFDSGYPRREFV